MAAVTRCYDHWLLLTGILTVFSGCSSPTTDFGEVHGRVTLVGQPLANVQVTFAPEKSSEKSPFPISTGTTDRDGNYRLKSANGTPGAAVGSHRVVVEDIAIDAPSASNSREAQDEKPPADARPPANRDVLPTPTNSCRTSLLIKSHNHTIWKS